MITVSYVLDGYGAPVLRVSDGDTEIVTNRIDYPYSEISDDVMQSLIDQCNTNLSELLSTLTVKSDNNLVQALSVSLNLASNLHMMRQAMSDRHPNVL